MISCAVINFAYIYIYIYIHTHLGHSKSISCFSFPLDFRPHVFPSVPTQYKSIPLPFFGLPNLWFDDHFPPNLFLNDHFQLPTRISFWAQGGWGLIWSGLIFIAVAADHNVALPMHLNRVKNLKIHVHNLLQHHWQWKKVGKKWPRQDSNQCTHLILLGSHKA